MNGKNKESQDEKQNREFNKKKKISFNDIMQSKPKFLIFSLLSMYPELTLKDLTKFTGKSKSSVSFHLNDMKNAHIVEVSRIQENRGKIPTKYFHLLPNFEQILANKDSNRIKSLDEEIRDCLGFLRVSLTFSQIQEQMLGIWQKYLLELIERVENGEYYTIENELKTLIKKTEKLTSVSFYTDKNSSVVRQKLIEILQNSEEVNKTKDFNKIHPKYVGVQILPLKNALDFFLHEK